MSIITKRGDTGFTDRLFGGKAEKTSELIEAIGNLDELNAFIGFANRNTERFEHGPKDLTAEIQENLVRIMGELSSSDDEKYALKFVKLDDKDISLLESEIYQLERRKKFNDWQYPTSYCDVACRVCRRAERSVWKLNKIEQVRGNILIYINRLSDYLWILGRKE